MSKILKTNHLVDICHDLGCELSRLRQVRGWSVEEAASQAGLSHAIVLQRLEEGVVRFPFIYLRMIIFYNQKIVLKLESN